MRASVALLTLAVTVAGCAAANTAGEVRGTVATVDWPNALVLLNDVRSAQTGAPVPQRWPARGGAAASVQATSPAGGGAAASVQATPQEITVQVPPSSTVRIEQQPARIIVQQAPPQVEVQPAPDPQRIMQGPPASGAPSREQRFATEPSARMHRPAPGRQAQQRPWCDGAYAFTAGTNFGKCAKAEGSAGKTETE
jgi:hypothetical protein